MFFLNLIAPESPVCKDPKPLTSFRWLEECDASFFILLTFAAHSGQYLPLLPYAEKLVRPGGLMISDNILRDGEVLDSRYLVERRNRTIHRRMREYLETLARSPEWRTYFAGTQDGNAVSVRL